LKNTASISGLAPRQRAIVSRIAEKHGARNVRLFGSYVRGQQHERSDIDLLVELPTSASLLDLIALKLDLQDALRRAVDVVTEAGLSPYLRDRILRDAVPL
jgi:predicted nucleotidyltransferase